MDLWTITEVYINHDYEQIGLNWDQRYTVVDIGAAIGEFSILAAKSCREVISFEPVKVSGGIFLKNIQANNLLNIKFLPNAVGNIQLKTLVNSRNFGNSKTVPSKTQTTKTFLVQDIVNLTSDDKLILKIDCEGAEYDIILGTKNEVLKKFSQIAMEWHEYNSNQKHTKLVKKLTKAGFHVKTHTNAVHNNIGFLYAYLPSKTDM